MTMKILMNSRRIYSQKYPQNFFNIIISGGGIIGQTMACALSKNPSFNNYNILLIESSQQKENVSNDNYSNRVSSIAPGTKSMLEKLGIWKHIKRHQVIKDMKVWGFLSNDYINFVNDINNPAYIVENDEIIDAAVKENMKAPNLKILYGSTIKDVNLNFDSKATNHQIKLSDDSLFDTNLLIGADGANSLIRNAMGTDYVKWNYKQFGIVATLNLSSKNENFTAWQRFLSDGPVAILPLTDGVSSLVWSVSENKAKILLKLADEAFVDALNDALHSEPQKNELVTVVNDCSRSLFNMLSFKSHSLPITPPYVSTLVKNSRAAFPLSFGHSSKYFKPRVVLIGDSAHKVHPLAGQGVNIGMRDIRNIVEKLSQGLRDGRELGHELDLRHYETEAQRQNVPLMAAIDSLHWIYTSNSNIMKAFGNVCFRVTESVTPLKTIMKQLTA